MKIAFIDPPWPGNGHRTQRWPHKNLAGDINPPPLFQMYAAAVTRNKGHEVALWDAPAQRISRDELIKKVQNFSPRVAVINTSTPSFDHDTMFISSLKKTIPETVTVAVGPHVSFFKTKILDTVPELDIIAVGEYENTIRKLLSNLDNLENVNGIVYRNNGIPAVSSQHSEPVNLDELPFPAYDLVDINAYKEFLFPPRQRPIATIISSRGCPYGCSFCVYPQLMTGKHIRFHSVERIMEEIKWLIQDFNAKFIYFDDDTFTASWERVEQICKAFIERRIKIRWGCLGRVNGITENRLKLMKKAGCYLIKYGVESGNQSSLNSIDKKIKLDEIKNAFQYTRRSKIYSHATVMFGIPGETRQNVIETLQLLHLLRPDFVQFSACTPFPGTKFYHDAIDNGWLQYEKWEDFDAAWNCVTEYPQLSRVEIKQLVQDGYKKYYLTIHYLWLRIMRSILGPDQSSQTMLNFSLLKKYVKRYFLNPLLK